MTIKKKKKKWQSKKTATPPSHSKNPILGRYIHQSFNSKSQNPRTSPSKNGFSSNELPSPPPPHPSILKPQTLFSQTPLPLSAQTHLHLCLRFLYYPSPQTPSHPNTTLTATTISTIASIAISFSTRLLLPKQSNSFAQGFDPTRFCGLGPR